MPNIFYNKFNKVNTLKKTTGVVCLKKKNSNKNNIDYTRYFPPANIEWYNNIYAYNRYSLKHLHFFDKMVITLIKSYFNLFNTKYDNKISSYFNSPSIISRGNTGLYKKKERDIKLRRLSINRIFVSKAELKHTNSKIIITIYVYNRYKKYIYDKIKKMDTIVQLNNADYIRKIKLESLNIIEQVNKENKLLAETFEWKDYEKTNSFLSLWLKKKWGEEKFLEDFVKKSLEKEMLKNYYENLLYLNKSKFENTYLLKFKDLISKFYTKKVEFNIVNLEYLYLNSDILSESIVLKLKKRSNRLLRVLKTSLNMIKLPFINKLSISNNLNKIKYNKTLSFNNVQNLNALLQIFVYKQKYPNEDEFDLLLQDIFPLLIEKKEEDIQKIILNNIKHKFISGVRLEATGRLTRRLTAARSVFKLKYKGSLKNIDSSYKGLSSVVLRGHVRSNIQYTNISSKTRNGSFGIKGWISNV
jgi:hypothetical protein